MTIIEAVRDWVSHFPQLDDLIDGIHIDLTAESDGSYGLELAGDKVITEYMSTWYRHLPMFHDMSLNLRLIRI